MIFTSLSRTDASIHQPGKRRQHVNGRKYAFAVQIPAQYELALSDVTSQVGDRVGNIVIWHGQDHQLGHRPRVVTDAPRALIYTGQVRIQVAGITSSARH